MYIFLWVHVMLSFPGGILKFWPFYLSVYIFIFFLIFKTFSAKFAYLASPKYIDISCHSFTFLLFS